MMGEANGKETPIPEGGKKPDPTRVEHEYRRRLVDQMLKEQLTGYDAAIIRGITTIMQIEGTVKDDIFEQLLSKLSKESGTDRAVRYTERIVNTFFDNPMFIIDIYHMCFHMIAKYEKDLPLETTKDINVEVCRQMKMAASPQAQEDVVLHATRKFVGEWVEEFERASASVRRHYDETISPKYVVTVRHQMEE